MNKFLLLFITGLLLLLAACRPTSGTGSGSVEPVPDPLANSQWTLVAFGSEAALAELLPATTITADFADGAISGQAGCNFYDASYTVNGRLLTVGPIAATERACLGSDVMAQEAEYLAALATASAFERTDNELVISYEGGALRYVQTEPPIPATLAGTVWQLSVLEQHSGQAVAATLVPPGMTITLTFADGQLSGSTTCNDFGAPYELDSDQLTVGAIIKTEAICPDETQTAVESHFFRGLAAAQTLAIEADQLAISYPDGRLLFQVQAMLVDVSPTPATDMIEPPPALLGVGAAVQTAGIGTYCWSEAQGAEMAHLCADMVGIPTAQVSLLAPASPFVAQLTLPLSQVPANVMMLTFPATVAAEQTGYADGYRWWDFPENVEAVSLPLTTEQEIVFELEPGLHVIQISAWWEGVGDATFGFLVEVTTEADQARETLVAFFDRLNNGRFAAAAELYGGSYEVMIEHNPDVDPNDHVGLLEQACRVNGAVCLGVKTAVFADQPAPNEFQFQVEFANADGSLFMIELPEQPAQSQFAFTARMTESGSFTITGLVYSP